MSEEEAEDAFAAIRYAATGGEPVCHHCACAVTYRIKRTVKNRKTGATHLRWLFKCANCYKQFSATAGTIFASRKLAHRDILFAIALYTNGAKGMSALQLSRDLDVQTKTAFVLLHKLREAMGAVQHAHTLSGEVEIDGAYYGGYVKPSTRAENRCDRRKLQNMSGRRRAVTIMRERNGRSRAFVLSELDAARLAPSVIAPDSLIYTDESKAYDQLESIFMVRRIDHSKSYAEEDRSTNWAENGHTRGCAGDKAGHRNAGAVLSVAE